MRRFWTVAVLGSVAACTGAGPSSETAIAPISSSSQVPESAAELGGLTCWESPVEPDDGAISFDDVTEHMGLVEPLTGMFGHAAAFGDVDGDGWLDIVFGTFGDRSPDRYRYRGAGGPSPDRLLFGGETFRAGADFAGEPGRSSGAVLADFDADGDPDLLLVRHAGLGRQSETPSVIFENRGGSLVTVAEPLPIDFLGRTPVVADFDGDGLLDLYVTEDRYGDRGGVLLHNQGGFSLVDATEGSGLEGVFALGAAAGDLNGDGHPELVTSDRVFAGTGDLAFRDVTPDGFGWEPIGPDDDPAGVAVGDVDNDGRLDVVVGHHFRSTVERDTEVAIRLFVNRTPGEGDSPVLEEVGEEAGIVPLPTVAPHIEVADIDNDGWPDIVTSASAFDGAGPAIFRNRQTTQVSFDPPEGLGSDQYWVGGPVGDVDRDGRLDVFGVEWEPELPSRMFRNTTAGGHWLQVSVSEPGNGVGWKVELLDDDGSVFGVREIAVSAGYASGIPPVAHFGLGERERVTLRVSPPGGRSVEFAGVPADRHLRLPEGC